MDEILLFIIYKDGMWNGLNYIGGEEFAATIKKKATFMEFVDTIYTATRIDKTKFDLEIYYLVGNGGRNQKVRIRDDMNYSFVVADDNKYKNIYVDTIVRDVGVSRPIVHLSAHTSEAHNQMQPPPIRTIAEGRNYFTSGTSDVGTSAGVNEAIECDGDESGHDDYLLNNVIGAEEARDVNGTTGDSDIGANEAVGGDTTDEDVEGGEREGFPVIRFSGQQFQHDPRTQFWNVPCAEDDGFRPTRMEEPIVFQRDRIYQGAIFSSKEELTGVVGQYALQGRFSYVVRRSDKERFEIGCKNLDCKFQVRARCRRGCTMWYVGKFEEEHDCHQSAFQSHFRQVKATTIGKIYSTKVARAPYAPSNVMAEMMDSYGVQILYTKAWRALEYAKKLAYGKPEESYQQLPSYFYVLRQTNPGTITAIKTDVNNCFLYSFFALGPSIQGFRSYIRPVIAIDASHLKGGNKGVIFCATCMDGDEHIYPIAFGFGDTENDDAWTWFLLKLRDAIGVPDDLVIISDRHLSIKSAMRVVFPSVAHAYCYVHMKNNLKKHCKNQVVKTLFKNAAYMYRPQECDKCMAEIQKLHPFTFKWLSETGVSKWARSYCPKNRYFMTTNIAESMNKCMYKARRLSITTAHEYLRNMLQRWFNERRSTAVGMTSLVTPAVDARTRKVAEESVNAGCVAHAVVQGQKYFVQHPNYDDGIVDIQQRTCTCRRWDLDGIPCVHASAAAREMRVDYNTLCSQYYSTEFLKAAYAPPINPVPQLSSGWDVPEEVSRVVVRPPVQKRQAGRPRESRIRSATESHRTNKCSLCGQQGHNRARCLNPPSSTSSRNIGESSSTATARAPRKCSICRTPGHTRRRCPERGDGQNEENNNETVDQPTDEGNDHGNVNDGNNENDDNAGASDEPCRSSDTEVYPEYGWM